MLVSLTKRMGVKRKKWDVLQKKLGYASQKGQQEYADYFGGEQGNERTEITMTRR